MLNSIDLVSRFTPSGRRKRPQVVEGAAHELYRSTRDHPLHIHVFVYTSSQTIAVRPWGRVGAAKFGRATLWNSMFSSGDRNANAHLSEDTPKLSTDTQGAPKTRRNRTAKAGMARAPEARP
jgi:hypothetical protein